MGKDKDKNPKTAKQRPSSMAMGEDLTKHPWPEVEAIQRDRERSKDTKTTGSTKSSFSETNSVHRDDPSGSNITKSKSTKKKGGLFSKFRKSTNDLSEWNKNDEKLSMAVDNDDVSKVAPLLSKKGVEATKLDPKGQTAFHRAAEQGKLAIVEVMLSAKADTNAQDVQGRTPLHCAVRYGRTQVAGRLIQENNNLTATDLKKQTALHHATIGGSADCVRLLISFRAPLDQPDTNGWSALFYAAKMGYQSICRELVEAGADINARDNTGRCPITFAAEYGQVQVCEFLVKKGADIHLKDNDGKDAKNWAAIGGYQEIKTFFDRAPTQAKWTTDLPSASESVHHEEINDTKVQTIAITADDTTEVTSYEEELKFDKLDLGITPLLIEKDSVLQSGNYHSSARVNCDEEDDVIAEAVVPMEEMRELDKQYENVPMNGDSVEANVYENVHSGVTHAREVVEGKDVTSSRTADDVVSIDAFRELEEEHDVLLAELQRISLENKHLKDKVEKLDSMRSESITDVNKSENGDTEEAKQHIEQLEEEVEKLRARLTEAEKRHGSTSDISKRPPSFTNVNDSWVDSGDEEDKMASVSREEQVKQIAVLKSQVLELSKQNEYLQSQLKLLDEVNHNEKVGDNGGSLQTQCDDLLAYKTRMQEELSNLQNFLQRKKTAICTTDTDIPLSDAEKENQEVWVIQKDVELICQQASVSSTELQDKNTKINEELERMRQENETLKEALLDLDSVNQQLLEAKQDEESQEAYRLQIQEETGRLQQEKHELTLLMQEIQMALKEKQQKEQEEQEEEERKAQARREEEEERKAQARREEEEMKAKQDVSTQQDTPESAGPLAALTMEGITLNVSDVSADKTKESSDLKLEKQNVEKQLSEEKLMLESVLKQVKEEKTKLGSIESKLVDSKDTLKTMNLQIEDLHRAIQLKEKENDELKLILNKHQIEVETLQKNKEEKLGELAELDSLFNSKQSEIDTSVALLKEKKDENDKLDLSLQSQKQALKDLQEDISTNNGKLLQLCKDNEQKETELLELQSKSEDLVKTISQTKEDKEKLIQEKDMLVLEKEALMAEHQQINTQLSADKAELENVQRNIAKLKDSEVEMKEPIKTEQIEPITALGANAVRTSPKLTELEDGKRLQIMFEQEKEIKELQDINQALVEQIEDQRQHSSPLNDSLLDKLKDENERLREENEYLLTNMNHQGSEEEDANFQQECEILKRENSRLYDDIKSLRTLIEKSSGEDMAANELTYLRTQNETLTGERQQLEVNNMELHSLMEALQQTLQEREQRERADLKRAVFEAMDKQRAAESDTDSEILDYKVELDDLKALNADQQSEIDKLRQENEDLEALNAAQQSDIEKLQHDKNDLESLQAAQQSDIGKIRQDKDDLEAALAELQDASEGMILTHNTGKEEFEVKITKYKEESKMLSEELTVANKENDTLKDTIRHLQEAAKSVPKPAENDVIEKYEKAQEDLENVTEQLEHTQEENEQFIQAIKELESQLMDQQKQADAIKEVNEDNDILVTEIKDLQKEIEVLTSDKNKLKEDSKNLVEQLQKSEKEKKDLEEENKDLLREQVKRHIEDGSETSANISSLDTSKGDSKPTALDNKVLKDELKTLRISMQDLQEKNKQLIVDIDSIREQLKYEADCRGTAEKALSETSQELQLQRDQNVELASQLEEFAAKLESIGADHEAELQEEQDRSQQEIDRMLDVTKDMTKELEHYKDLIEDLRDDNDAKVQDLMEEQDFLLEKIKALETNKAAKEKTFENEDINEKDEIIQELETQVEEFKEKLDDAKKELETLQNENERYKKEALTEEEKAAAKVAESSLKQLQEENKQLIEQVEALKDELANKSKPASPVPSPEPSKIHKENRSEENEQLLALQKSVISLQHQLQEVEKRHKDVVNTYRTHLLAAAEGRMDPEVKQALMHIIKLRTPEDTQSC